GYRPLCGVCVWGVGGLVDEPGQASAKKSAAHVRSRVWVRWVIIILGVRARGYLLSRPKVKVVIPDLGTTSGTSSTTATATPRGGTKGDSRLLLLSETVTEPGTLCALHRVVCRWSCAQRVGRCAARGSDLRQLPEEVRGYVLE